MKDLFLRKATAADKEFAYKVKKASFRRYIDMVWEWDESEQRQLHNKRFASQEFFVIQRSGADIGIIAIEKKPDVLKVNQLFLLPRLQNKGIGHACMKQIIANANEELLPVRLRVLKVNPRAVSFYKKMGFIEIGRNDTHIMMEKQS